MGRLSARQLKEGTPGSWMRDLLSFLLGVLLASGGYLYLIREKSLSPKDFSQKVFLIDQMIQSQLYEMGISKEDVLLRESFPKKEKDLSWEQSLWKIQLPPSVPFPWVEGNFRKTLSPFATSVSLESSRAKDFLRLEVAVRSRITHRLTFIPSTPSVLKAALHPKIAIVMDDLGEENKISQELLRWDLPMTFSILPFTPYSKALAREAHRRGKEIILHLPMEPHEYPKTKLGEGALLEEMDEKKLLQQLSEDIETVPHIKGVSNHMGSRFTEDPEKMRIVFFELKRRGLFFLDSRTTPQTVGLLVAQSVGLKAMERSLFIDHSLGEEEIRQKLERLIQISLSTGKAIGIGHPHPSTLKSLKEIIPKMKEKGIQLVPLSTFME